MLVERREHVQLAMPSGREQDAVAFYERLAGSLRSPSQRTWQRQAGAGSSTAISRCTSASRRSSSRLARPSLPSSVQDVRRRAAAISAAGFEVMDDEPLAGYDRVYVYDPFGNRLELMEPLA